MKYPVLMVGLILFGLYLSNPKTKEFWSKHFGKMKPSTCRVVKERFEKNSERKWDLECLNTQSLFIKAKTSVKPRAKQYMEVVNNFAHLANNSNHETLEFLKKIQFSLSSDKLTIIAKTDGEALVRLTKIKDKKDLAEFLKLAIKVKEIKK